MNKRNFQKQAKKFNVFFLLKNRKIKPKNRKKEIILIKYKQLYILQKIKNDIFTKKVNIIFEENNLIQHPKKIYTNNFNYIKYRMGNIISNTNFNIIK